MNKIVSIVFLFFLFRGQLWSQITPAEGGKLHYRIIGFSIPAKGNARNFKLQIAAGNFQNEDAFKTNIIVTEESSAHKIIAEVPDFGKEYTWRMVYKVNDQPQKTSLYHFSTISIPDVDTNIMRLRVVTTAEKYKDAYIFLNANRTLYDMNGHPIWFLPHTPSLNFTDRIIRDMKLTPQGTITFIVEAKEAYEINYDGDMLWKAPNTGAISGDSIEHYNHEFVRLANGHYMLSGTEITWLVKQQDSDRQAPSTPPSKNGPPPGMRYRMMPKMPFGTLMEYDEQGKLVWSWRSASYFRSSDVLYYTNVHGRPVNDVHQNSFYFDEKNKTIYVGYKTINRIVKLKYPEGTVVASYGEVYKKDVPPKGNGLFCYQHSCKLSSKGNLYLFNNNSCSPTLVPQLIEMEEPRSPTDPLKVVWQYNCPIEPIDERTQRAFLDNPDLTSGGNIIELPDESFFASMCIPFPKVFIVGRDKKLLWSAIPEGWNSTDNKWMPIPQYRASIITSRRELETLIWNAAIKK
jgi:Arylsulfotransferase (ASST)